MEINTRFLDFRGQDNLKFRPNKRAILESQPKEVNHSISEMSPERQVANIKFNALRSKLYLSVKDREGKNRLLENYLVRIQGILGA